MRRKKAAVKRYGRLYCIFKYALYLPGGGGGGLTSSCCHVTWVPPTGTETILPHPFNFKLGGKFLSQ